MIHFVESIPFAQFPQFGIIRGVELESAGVFALLERQRVDFLNDNGTPTQLEEVRLIEYSSAYDPSTGAPNMTAALSAWRTTEVIVIPAWKCSSR